MRIIQELYSEIHENAFFYHGVIADGEKDNKKYTLETYQDGEIGYEENLYVGDKTPELRDTDLTDNDIEDEVIVDVYVDKFFTIKHEGRRVQENLTFNNYNEAIDLFKTFLI